MKKLLLSSFLIVSFVIYSLREQSNGPKAFTASSPNNFLGIPQTSGTPNSQTVTNYKDGEYTGDAVDAYYGNVQVKAVIRGGKITDVQFLDYPQDRRNSININTRAMPNLKTEVIQAQSASVDIVSGATQTSKAFIQSLQSALAKARV